MISNHKWTRADTVITLAIALLALAAYVRTLAPDLLYSDSAEFQTLAYTLGTPHSTGYPTYLLLARLVGLLPIGTPAWRINLVSALGAAVAVGGVYLLARQLTPDRIGPALGSLALALSGLFWSQAIIAEVYTPALAWLAIILALLWRWDAQFPGRCNSPQAQWTLFAASTLAGLGLGMHMYVGLIAPAAVVWVLWRILTSQGRSRWNHLGLAALGTLLGLVLLFGGFLLIDLNAPPSNFVDVAIRPSRSIWSLSTSDLDAPLKRIWLTISGRQWQDAMFPDGQFWRLDEIGEYADLLGREFSWVVLLCAVGGLIVMVWRAPRAGVFVLLAMATTVWVISNYHPGDQELFYMPTFVLIAVAAGVGAGFILDRVCVWTTPSAIEQKKPSFSIYHLIVALVFGMLILLPSVEARWQALQTGVISFSASTYVYPVENLAEPRYRAHLQTAYVPDDAVLVLDWRGLYSAAYLAHVEQGRTGMTFIEATPHGGSGKLADSMLDDLEQMVRDGRPVFVERVYEPLRERFRVLPVPLGKLYRLSLPNKP